MKTLVVYDSFFGNTKQVALAISDGLASEGSCETLHVSNATPEHLKGLDVLIVGSPTRAFRPTKLITDFLNSIPKDGLKGIRVAAFDTRISTADVRSRFLSTMVGLFGYAAKPIADKLAKKGGTLIAQPEGFFVNGSEGPLKDNELKRASTWVKSAIKAGPR
jgi:flavodoxin